MLESICWQDFADASPELAAFGEARFRQGIAFLATIRRDGSPRMHPVSPDIIDGHLLYSWNRPLQKATIYYVTRATPCMATSPRLRPTASLCAAEWPKRLRASCAPSSEKKAPNVAERYVLFEFLI